MFSINIFVFFGFIICVVQASPTSNVGIIGGHTISIEKAPYMASLRLNGTIHWCGSSIIHEKFILTAAHCIVPNREYKVLVGTDKIDEGGSLYNVTQIIVHPKYANKTNDYDISLLKLSEKLEFGTTVNKIPLNNGTVKVKRGLMLSTAGWGLTTPNGNLSSVLREVKVPVVSNRYCQLAYGLKPITKRMLCAGGQGRDSCQADSGGPLTFNDVLVGVTSFGLGCGNVPGVYARVSRLVPWILETIGLNL